MPFDKFVDIDKIDDDRRNIVMKSILPDDPWRQTLLELIAENPGATFYHADAGEGVMFLYSRDIDKGLWYLSGSGTGPLSARARQMMKEAIGKS